MQQVIGKHNCKGVKKKQSKRSETRRPMAKMRRRKNMMLFLQTTCGILFPPVQNAMSLATNGSIVSREMLMVL
jgi:hypothetical protein